jgi:WD40 repeat protein
MNLPGHKDSVWSLDWRPDGKALVSGSRDQTVKPWEAATQNDLGIALQDRATRSNGEEGNKLLWDFVSAYRSALEFYTKDGLPESWARAQYNLGIALNALGTRTNGEEGRKLLKDALAAYRSWK